MNKPLSRYIYDHKRSYTYTQKHLNPAIINSSIVLHTYADNMLLATHCTHSALSRVQLTWPQQSQSRWLDYTEIRQKMSSSGHSSESVKLSSGKTNSMPWAIRAATSYKSSLHLVWNCFLFYSLSFIMLISANPFSECESASILEFFQMFNLLMQWSWNI